MSREHDHNMASPPQQPIIYSGCLRQRDPSTFSGTDDQDVEDWLSSYERVSSFNKWDDVLKLNNIIFYLTNVAKLWFKNHEAEFQTWPRFKARFVEVFGRPAVRLLCAEQRLRERAQQAGENFTSYIEDILDLCKRVNPVMPETEKIKHILKGIEDGAFHMLLGKNAETVTEVVNLCQSYEELRRQRLQTRPQQSRDSCAISGLAVAPDISALLPRIQDFIREEVARQISILPCVTQPTPTAALPSSLRQVIQEEVAEALPASLACQSVPTVPPVAPVVTPLAYAEVAARPPRQGYPAFQRPAPAPAFVAARPAVQPANPWRTLDNRPICFACGIPGHVARFCRRRVLQPSDAYRAPTYVPHQSYDHAPADPSRYVVPPEGSTFNTRRSPSPRRRSVSPMRRRPAPAQEEN